jgi:hypothetical protein
VVYKTKLIKFFYKGKNMKEKLSKIRTGGKVVSEISIPQYETLEEILSSGKTEAQIVSCFNTANTIEIQGIERNKFVPARVGKEQKRKLAFNLLTFDELLSVKKEDGTMDAVKFETLINSKLPEVEAKLAEIKA